MNTNFARAVALLILSAALGAPSAAQTPGSVTRDCADCPEMVVIPAGTFQMGTKRDPVKNYRPRLEEQPQHAVTLKAFALGKYEVTQEQWQAVMGELPPQGNTGPNLPVESISWVEVQMFILKLNLKTGKTYRLPTEAEWEYAARAGSKTVYSFGDQAGRLGAYAWYRANAAGKSHPVGLKRPNRFGLFDMHGNVWEWVQDCYVRNYTDASPVGAEPPPREVCSRVNRGGSWRGLPDSLRSATRVRDLPIGKLDDLGFRLAKTLP